MVKKLVLATAAALFLVISLAFILPDQWLEAKPLVLLATDIASVGASVAACVVGITVARKYGGSFGKGLGYVLSGIGVLGALELTELLYRLGVEPAEILLKTVGYFRIENIFVTTAMLLFLYGIWKMGGE